MTTHNHIAQFICDRAASGEPNPLSEIAEFLGFLSNMALTGRQERVLAGTRTPAAQSAWGSIFHAAHMLLADRAVEPGGALTSLVASIEQAARLDDEAARIRACDAVYDLVDHAAALEV
jgi:hypothetical protein